MPIDLVGSRAEQVEVVCHTSPDSPILLVVPVGYGATSAGSIVTAEDVIKILPFVPAPDLIDRIVLMDRDNPHDFCDGTIDDAEATVGFVRNDIYLFRAEPGKRLVEDVLRGWSRLAYLYFEMEQEAYNHAYMLEAPNEPGWQSVDWVRRLVGLITEGCPATPEPATALRTLVLGRLLEYVATRSGAKAAGLCVARAEEVQKTYNVVSVLKNFRNVNEKSLAMLAVWLLDKPETVLNSRRLDLSGEKITDVHVARLVGLAGLEELDLSGTLISDQSLSKISQLTGLKKLNLSGTRVHNSALKLLQGLPLTELLLSGTEVSDGGMSSVGKIFSLKALDLSRTAVTGSSLEFLQRALPHCRIST